MDGLHTKELSAQRVEGLRLRNSGVRVGEACKGRALLMRSKHPLQVKHFVKHSSRPEIHQNITMRFNAILILQLGKLKLKVVFINKRGQLAHDCPGSQHRARSQS